MHIYKYLCIVLILCTGGALAAFDNDKPSCQANGYSRCCPGRDSSCVVSANQIYGQSTTGGRSCYCDEGCLETGDCCDDYKDTCSVKVVDCQVSHWSIWGPCDRSCGKGTQTRTRLVTTHPSPTGNPCGTLEQSRLCMGSRCSRNYYSYKNALRETAGLLPAKYLKKTRSGRKWDVRENLFNHKKQLKNNNNKDKYDVSENEIDQGYQADQPQTSNEYCIVFELTRVTKACKTDKDFYKMQKGQQMCALCPEDAKRTHLGNRCEGHGVDSRMTRWRSTVGPKCHGKWTRVYEMSRCPCRSGPDFIFV